MRCEFKFSETQGILLDVYARFYIKYISFDQKSGAFKNMHFLRIKSLLLPQKNLQCVWTERVPTIFIG